MSNKGVPLIKDGNNLVIPAGAIKLSLDPEKSNVKFTREGIGHYVSMDMFSGFRRDPEEIDKIIEDYSEQAWQILNEVEDFSNLDLYNEKDFLQAKNLLDNKHNTTEWWALSMHFWLVELKSALSSGRIKEATWAMAGLVNARAMLSFHQNLSSLVWRGYRIDTIRDVLRTWKDNGLNSDEEFWQKTITENAFILSQVFSYPVLILKGKAYVGGKSITNTDAKLADFVLQNNLSGNTALLEIKTPTTKLLGKEYRSGIFNVSSELSGAVQQVSNYKDSFIKSYYTLKGESDISFETVSPQCLVIVGNIKEELIDSKMVRSFELFRNGLRYVTLLTYDELFMKIEALLELLE